MKAGTAKPDSSKNSTSEAIGRIADLAMVDYSSLVRRRLRRFAFQAAAAAFLVLAALAATGAGAVVLAQHYGAVSAMLIIAGAALLIALAIFLAGMLADRTARRTEAMLMENRRMAMVGALSLLAGKPRRSMTLLVVLGAVLALRRVLLRRG